MGGATADDADQEMIKNILESQIVGRFAIFYSANLLEIVNDVSVRWS